MSEQTYTVGQVARLSGVTVRTLHHYDEIGLLPPSGRAANGYRTYTKVDVARLQRVLSWRELVFDLLDRIERLQAVAATVAKTLEAHEMGINLTPEEMLEVFGDHDPAEHVAEAERRWATRTRSASRSVARRRTASRTGSTSSARAHRAHNVCDAILALYR